MPGHCQSHFPHSHHSSPFWLYSLTYVVCNACVYEIYFCLAFFPSIARALRIQNGQEGSPEQKSPSCALLIGTHACSMAARGAQNSSRAPDAAEKSAKRESLSASNYFIIIAPRHSLYYSSRSRTETQIDYKEARIFPARERKKLSKQCDGDPWETEREHKFCSSRLMRKNIYLRHCKSHRLKLQTRRVNNKRLILKDNWLQL